MDDGLKSEFPPISDVDRFILNGLDAANSMSETLHQSAVKAFSLPTSKNIEELEGAATYSVIQVAELVDHIDTLDMEEDAKIEMLAGVFAETRMNRTKLMFGSNATLIPNYKDRVHADFLEAFELEEEDGVIYTEGGEMYTFAGYITELFKRELVSDLDQFAEPYKDSLKYKVTAWFERNKETMVASGIGAFLGVLATSTLRSGAKHLMAKGTSNKNL